MGVEATNGNGKRSPGRHPRKLTPKVVVRYGRLRQDVRAAWERDVEVVQYRQRIRGPMLLHQQVLQEKLQRGQAVDLSTGESGARVRINWERGQ